MMPSIPQSHGSPAAFSPAIASEIKPSIIEESTFPTIHPPVIHLWFSHAVSGEFLSFYSDDAAGLNQQVNQIVGQREHALFRPVNFPAYQQVLDRIVQTQKPEQLNWAFWWNGSRVNTQITLNAIVLPTI